MINYQPQKLLEYIRDGLVEQEHSGFIGHLSADKTFSELGDSNNYPYYLRSCAKPLQASLLIDYGLDEFYNMSLEEIAVCCASHAGEPCHTRIVQVLLDKIGIDSECLKCGLHSPISKTEQNKLIIKNTQETILQNNCSGKHSMMLAICKKKSWDTKNYDEINHPVQVAIKKKIYDLCEIKKEYPNTKDGCGVPIYSMPLKNMLIGYSNLFFSPQYEKIKNAFIQNPYLIGGENRLDTAIMSANNNIIAKVGAGGICIAVNLEKKEALVIKVLDCDMKARAIALIEALKQLNWLDGRIFENDLIKAQNNREIKTLHGEKIGSMNVCFDSLLFKK